MGTAVFTDKAEAEAYAAELRLARPDVPAEVVAVGVVFTVEAPDDPAPAQSGTPSDGGTAQ